MNVNMFKGKMVENELTQEQVAKELGISIPSFRRKMYNDKFTISEINVLSRLLSLTEREFISIFFNNLVA